jgi:uncharacterized membrane protein (UPF0127 family)
MAAFKIRVRQARGFLGRARGWLGLAEAPDQEALWLKPCSAVHTFGMRFELDLVFLDRKQRVLSTRHQVRPFRACWHPGACSTVELPAGFLQKYPVAVGDTAILESFP